MIRVARAPILVHMPHLTIFLIRVAAFINPFGIGRLFLGALGVKRLCVKERVRVMKSCKECATPVQGNASSRGADMGLWADVLEPSRRYEGVSLPRGRVEAGAVGRRDFDTSLESLRVPKSTVRVGFRDFLD